MQVFRARDMLYVLDGKMRPESPELTTPRTLQRSLFLILLKRHGTFYYLRHHHAHLGNKPSRSITDSPKQIASPEPQVRKYALPF